MMRRLRKDSRCALAVVAAVAVFAFARPSPAADETEKEPPISSAATADEDIKTIAVGTADILDFDFEPNPVPLIGNKTILEVQPGNNPKQFKVIPLKKGTSSLIVSTVSGKIAKKYVYNVITNDLSAKVLTIRRLLQDIEGITIESVDDKIVIDGELVVPRDLDRILQVEAAYKDVVFDLVSLSKLSREAIARRMQKEINDDPGGVNVTVRIINDTFFLFGKVDSTTDRDRALTIAETYLPELMGSVALRENAIMTAVKKVAIRNMIQVEEPPAPPAPRMVRITYHFVEIGKDYLKQNMFKWVPLIQEQQNSGLQIGEKTNGGVGAQSSNGSFSATITNLLPKLSAASNGGFSRVLFSTVQLTEDKVKTKLSRQEQIPFVGAVVNGVPVTSTANMGIVVEVEPEILGDKVRLACNFSFSTPVGNGAGGQPRVISSASENRIIVKSGESAAIAGLIDNRAAKNVNKDPENTPPGNPIFTLLRSKAFSASKSQFVVFITPKIIDDASEGTADIKAKILNNGMKKRRRTVQ